MSQVGAIAGGISLKLDIACATILAADYLHYRIGITSAIGDIQCTAAVLVNDRRFGILADNNQKPGVLAMPCIGCPMMVALPGCCRPGSLYRQRRPRRLVAHQHASVWGAGSE